MIKTALSTLFVLVACLHLQASSLYIDVTEEGALSDTNYLSTTAFQKAIDRCYENPEGGIVYVPPGNFKTGTIVLKRGTTLYIDSGATIWASKNINDYRMPLDGALRPVLIYANGAESISIIGKGTIHGRASHDYRPLEKVDRFIKDITQNAEKAGVEMKRYYVKKPDISLINLVNCRMVMLSDITVTQSPFWSVHLAMCTDVVIQHVSVFSSLEKGVNSDGIDLNSCKNVFIQNCVVETGDDGIVIKSRHTEPSENIIVKHCSVSSSSTALKLGTESLGDFRNITFDSCSIPNTNRGPSIVVREGGTAENITFSNIDMNCSRRHFNWWGNADPIWIYLTLKKSDSDTGMIQSVQFKNIVANGMGTSKIESTVGNRIKDITFDNVRLNMFHEDYADKRATDAFYIEHVDGLVLKDISIQWQDELLENWQSALSLYDVKNARIEQLKGESGNSTLRSSALKISDSHDIELTNYQYQNGDKAHIEVLGERTSNIILKEVNNAEDLLIIGNEVVKSEIHLQE